MNGPEILDKYVGESEANIRKLFQEAEEDERKLGREFTGSETKGFLPPPEKLKLTFIIGAKTILFSLNTNPLPTPLFENLMLRLCCLGSGCFKFT